MKRAGRCATLAAVLVVVLAGCGWRGVNSLALPGTAGRDSGAYTITAELPDVTNIEPNSRVRVGDVTVGNVVKIERRGWHAAVTITLDGDVELPENATATVGQTSLLGTLHIELAAPTDHPAQGRLHNGSVIPLDHAGTYPSTEQTLAAISLLLNGGGIGQLQDITQAFGTALRGREQQLRDFLGRIHEFTSALNAQRDDIITATEGLDRLAGQFAAQDPVIDEAVRTIPDALTVLADRREQLAGALTELGTFSALTNDTVTKTRDSLVAEMRDLAPVLESLADAGPALTRSLSLYTTYPWPKETIPNWFRGDYANLTLVLDLTLSRLDATLLTGTRFEGDLTELELQWGRTIGQIPSPYTAANPLTAPYHLDQGR
ncbi:MCE family protein [Mycolicibacterium sp.]|uniref:MCE family protein n=1 Tax=Mycolicibacterium sp. TaxID=2320850 RepID=UPI003D0E757E